MIGGFGLGIRLLAFGRTRLLIAFSAIAVAVVIMFVQLGLLLGILDSQAMIANLVKGDLVVMSRSRTNLHKWNDLDRIRLSQIASQPGVERVVPVYQSTMGILDPKDRVIRRIVIMAFPPSDVPLAIGDADEIGRALQLPDTVLYDRRSRPIFGAFDVGDDVELDGALYRVAGFVDIGPDIVNDGIMVMGDGTWLAGHPGAQPIMGAIRLTPGVAAERAKERILAALPDDISVFTPQEVRSREISFTLRSAPIGLLFGIGMLSGLVIGSVTCYQILFIEIMDRIKQYAMLKAMGFSDAFLRRIILEQSILLSCGGFALGFVAAWAVYAYVAKATFLAVRLSVFSTALILALATVMSVTAGLIALRRVAAADPAELY